MKTQHESVSIPQHVCTIKDPRLANGVLIALVGFSIAGTVWLLSAMLAGRSHLKPPELVRHLTRAVSESCNGVLSDDATAVCPDWHRPQAPGRTG